MRCAEVESLLMRYVDGRLDAPRAGQLDTHLEVCPRCRKSYEDEVELVATFHAGGLRPAGAPFLDAVMREVDELEQARERGRRVPVHLGPGGRWTLAAAAAAAVMVGWQTPWLAPLLGAGAGGPGWALPEALAPAQQWAHGLAGSIEAHSSGVRQLWLAASGALTSASQEHSSLFSLITIVAAVACIALIGGFLHKPVEENRK